MNKPRYVVYLGGTVIRRNEHLGPIFEYLHERFGSCFMDNYINCIGVVGRSWTADGLLIDIMVEV